MFSARSLLRHTAIVLDVEMETYPKASVTGKKAAHGMIKARGQGFWMAGMLERVAVQYYHQISHGLIKKLIKMPLLP